MSGGGGSADAHTSLNIARRLTSGVARRWGRREWVLLCLALLPLVVFVVVGLLI